MGSSKGVNTLEGVSDSHEAVNDQLPKHSMVKGIEVLCLVAHNQAELGPASSEDNRHIYLVVEVDEAAESKIDAAKQDLINSIFDFTRDLLVEAAIELLLGDEAICVRILSLRDVALALGLPNDIKNFTEVKLVPKVSRNIVEVSLENVAV